MDAKRAAKAAVRSSYVRFLVSLSLTLGYQFSSNPQALTLSGIVSLIITALLRIVDFVYEHFTEVKGLSKRDKELIRRIRKTRKIRNMSDAIRQLATPIKAVGITNHDIACSYDEPPKAILLMKSGERLERKKTTRLRKRLQELGFKHLRAGVHVLSPVKTPQSLESQDDLRHWVESEITRPLNAELEYVFPFVTLLDMRTAFSKRTEEKGKKPEVPPIATAHTLDERLGPEDFHPPAVFRTLRRKRKSIEYLIKRGDIVFLAAKSLPELVLSRLERSEGRIIEKLKKATGNEKFDLNYFASMSREEEKTLARALRGYVPHENRVARDIHKEALYWMGFMKETFGRS